jgi:hypothetical protein
MRPINFFKTSASTKLKIKWMSKKSRKSKRLKNTNPNNKKEKE